MPYPVLPIRTDLLELRTAKNERVYHSMFPSGRCGNISVKAALDAIEASGFTHVVAEAAHEKQGFVPGDRSYSFLDDPQRFIDGCAPALDRGLRILVNAIPEGAASFNVRKFLDRQYPRLAEACAKASPLFMGQDTTEANELLRGEEIMELAAIHHQVVPKWWFLIHFNTGYSHPPGRGKEHEGFVGFRDFWWKGVTVKGRFYKGVLKAHPRSALSYQFPKLDGASSSKGFTSTPAIVAQETYELAVKRKLPMVAGEYSHKQTPANARMLGQAHQDTLRKYKKKFLGDTNGGAPWTDGAEALADDFEPVIEEPEEDDTV